MNIRKTYEDLENELIDFLEPIKATLPQLSPEVFDEALTEAVEMVTNDKAIYIIKGIITMNLLARVWEWHTINKGAEEGKTNGMA